MRNVMFSAAEAESGCLFDTCKEGLPIGITLEEMGHPQPTTPTHQASTRSIEMAGGPMLGVKYGRVDAKSPEQCSYFFHRRHLQRS